MSSLQVTQSRFVGPEHPLHCWWQNWQRSDWFPIQDERHCATGPFCGFSIKAVLQAGQLNASGAVHVKQLEWHDWQTVPLGTRPVSVAMRVVLVLAKYPAGQLSLAKRQVCCMEKKKVKQQNTIRGELWNKARGERSGIRPGEKSLGMRSHLHYLHPPEW